MFKELNIEMNLVAIRLQNFESDNSDDETIPLKIIRRPLRAASKPLQLTKKSNEDNDEEIFYTYIHIGSEKYLNFRLKHFLKCSMQYRNPTIVKVSSSTRCVFLHKVPINNRSVKIIL